MSLLDDIVDDLAKETLKIIDATGDDACVQQIADAIGGSSQTMEEAFTTAVRLRRAERRARSMIQQIRDKMATQLPAPGND